MHNTSVEPNQDERDNKITVSQAVERAEQCFGITVHDSLIRRACQNGRIEGAVRVKYMWYFLPEAFDQWVAYPRWQMRGRRLPKAIRQQILPAG